MPAVVPVVPVVAVLAGLALRNRSRRSLATNVDALGPESLPPAR